MSTSDFEDISTFTCENVVVDIRRYSIHDIMILCVFVCARAGHVCP